MNRFHWKRDFGEELNCSPGIQFGKPGDKLES